jgi:hypothetical protein
MLDNQSIWWKMSVGDPINVATKMVPMDSHLDHVLLDLLSVVRRIRPYSICSSRGFSCCLDATGKTKIKLDI